MDLEEAIAERDLIKLYDAMTQRFEKGFSPNDVPALLTLLEEPWHTSHEDAASTLQRLKDPRSVEGLGKAVNYKFDYLDYDNSYPFARKCVWALADIGNAAAKEALEKIARHEDPEIAGYAQRRLDRWEEELPRKAKII